MADIRPDITVESGPYRGQKAWWDPTQNTYIPYSMGQPNQEALDLAAAGRADNQRSNSIVLGDSRLRGIGGDRAPASGGTPVTGPGGTPAINRERQQSDWLNSQVIPASQRADQQDADGIAYREALARQNGAMAEGYQNGNLGRAQQIADIGANANQFSWQNQGVYDDALANSTARGDALYGDLANRNASEYGRLGATTQWAGDLSSQGASARADQQYIDQQNGFISGLKNIGNGSLNVTSQGAAARADALDLQRQQDAYGALGSVANGSLNNISMGAQAMADQQAEAMQYEALRGLGDAAWGSKDVKPGSVDPEAYASAHDALKQYRGLTDPTVTDKERFIYEQQRMNEEQDQRAARGANLTNLRQRGMSGSGMELANAQLASQQNSQNRLLGDLGANAGAVDRAMTALQGYGQLGTTLNAQANQLGSANMDRQLQANQAYATGAGVLRGQTFDEAFKRGSATDDMANANSDRQWAATNAQGGMSTDMRNASFDESYKRGTAADTVNTNNSDRQLNATNMGATQAGKARDSSFAEAESRGMAADNMSRYNRTQSNAVSEFRDTYAANQQNDAWNRQTDVTNAGYKSLDNYNANTRSAFDTREATNATTAGRTATGVNAQQVAADKNYASGGQVLNAFGGVQDARDAASGASFARKRQIGADIGSANAPLIASAANQAAIDNLNEDDNDPIKTIGGAIPIFGGFFK